MAMRASAPSRNVGDAQGGASGVTARTHDGALNRASRRRTPPGASGSRRARGKRYGSGH